MTELIHILCSVFAIYIFWHKKYELSLTIDTVCYMCIIYQYIDDLSASLNACRVGCCVGNEIIIHLLYADDLVIMALSVAGLSKLLRIL